MDLRPLRYFVAVAETEHLTRAAEQLHITQSTLSHSIQQLEAQVQVPLFDRVGRGIRLTQAGQLFLGFANRAIKEVENGIAALAESENLLAGRLRIGVIPSINISVMPLAVSRFVTLCPQVHLTVDEMSAVAIEQGLESGALDFGIALSPTTSANVVAENLFDERLMLIAHRDSSVAQSSSIRSKRLREVNLALLSPRYATRRLIDRHYGDSIGPSLKLEMNSVHALLRTVRYGGVATILNERALLQEEDLVMVEITHPVAIRTTSIVWSRTGYRTAAARKFAEIVTEQLKN